MPALDKGSVEASERVEPGSEQPSPRNRPADPLGWDDARLLECLAAARRGSARGFEDVYHALAPGLLRYAKVLVRQDAEDVTAEAWLQIFRDFGCFEGDWDAFRAWTTRIVRNRAIDSLRATARRPAAPVDVLTDMPDDGADPMEAVEELLSTAAALRMVAGLPKEQAEAVLLRVVIGLDAAAVGRVLGKQAGAVRVAAHRGLRELGRRIDSSTLPAQSA